MNTNAINYFSSPEFAKASLYQFVEAIDHYFGQNDFANTDDEAVAVFGEFSDEFDTSSTGASEFFITEFLKSVEGKAAYLAWCKNNAQARAVALESTPDYDFE